MKIKYILELQYLKSRCVMNRVEEYIEMTIYFELKICLISPIFIIPQSWNCMIVIIEMTIYFESKIYLISPISKITKFIEPRD